MRLGESSYDCVVIKELPVRKVDKSMVCLAMLLTACARDFEDLPEGTPQTEYSAVGREPDWALRFDRERISFTSDGGDTRVTAVRPIAVATSVGQRYATSRIVVDIVPGACDGALSGSGFEDRVIVTLAGRTFRGCGGNRVAESGF